MPARFIDLPEQAAWHHRDARNGFEVVFLGAEQLQGSTAAVEDGDGWCVGYDIALGRGWRTRSASVTSLSASGRLARELRSDGAGEWWIDGEPATHLSGCLDVDLESSALTNAFPVHRLGLEVGEEADAPAAYVRALDLSVERLEQRYVRLEDAGGRERYR